MSGHHIFGQHFYEDERETTLRAAFQINTEVETSDHMKTQLGGTFDGLSALELDWQSWEPCNGNGT